MVTLGGRGLLALQHLVADVPAVVLGGHGQDREQHRAHPVGVVDPGQRGRYGDEPDGWSALCEEVAEDREAYEQGLRLTWEHEDDFDPLLGKIGAAAERDAGG